MALRPVGANVPPFFLDGIRESLLAKHGATGDVPVETPTLIE